MALNATFTQVLGVDLTLFTVIVGHATFCIVLVYNNAVAAAAPDRHLPGGGRERPCGSLADLPRRHLPAAAHRPRRGCAARLRPLVRRDHRYHVHGRLAADPADLDLHELLAAEPAADRERCRPARDPPVDHPGLPREQALAGPRRGRLRRPPPGRRARADAGWAMGGAPCTRNYPNRTSLPPEVGAHLRKPPWTRRPKRLH